MIKRLNHELYSEVKSDVTGYRSCEYANASNKANV